MYMANNFVLNPAVAGIESYTDLKRSARSQWTGIAGADRRFSLAMDETLKQADSLFFAREI